VDWRLLNAADYGLPQHRVRLVVVGMRADQAAWSWPEPTHSRAALIHALRADDYWDQHEVPDRVRRQVRRRLPPLHAGSPEERWVTLRDVVRRLGPPSSSPNGDPSHVLVPGARLYPRHTGSPLDWPAKSVKAGVHGSPGGEHVLLRDTGTFRYLTVRECAALQGFPDDYALPSLRGHAMRQLGNAVPVGLAEALGKRMAKALGVLNGSTSKPSR
jgi:DNA (cytosine-5)-methyltransferase 1